MAKIPKKYEDWILSNVEDNPLGLCQATCKSMKRDFPELKLVRGHYLCPFWGSRGHWWLVAPDGVIVDPTVEQFPSKGMGEYLSWREGDPEPIGKCMNCGEYVWNMDAGTSSACSKECAADLEREFGCKRSIA